jgi:(4-(4-[2-(gamma-L-glutamylamino)ethyl]phenoxymethyl)furan-2-yl)methanamine synthase
MTGVIIGWDLGGANLKLARLEGGQVVHVAQIPCPLIPDRRKFDQALDQAFALCPAGALHAVTMTGELSDVFADRQEGVAYLVGLMQEACGQPLLIYGGKAGFLDPGDAARCYLDVASANWRASAVFTARHCADGLLVDTGTTTTDLVPLRAGAPAVRGYTDGERLTEGELVYTGVVRTPVMAIAQEAPFQGRMQGIVAERFATMADIYRLAGDLPDDADPYPTADQRGKSRRESAARLTRMLGRDADDAEFAVWIELARYFADCQLAQLEKAAQTLIAREQLNGEAPVIGAGCGRFVVKRLAARLDRPYLDFADIIDAAPDAREMAARSAPAVAVALLAEQELAGRDTREFSAARPARA